MLLLLFVLSLFLLSLFLILFSILFLNLFLNLSFSFYFFSFLLRAQLPASGIAIAPRALFLSRTFARRWLKPPGFSRRPSSCSRL